MADVSRIVRVRVNAQERELLENAAGRARVTLSEFVRRRALEAAEIDVLGRTVVTISAEAWQTLEAWAAEPAKDVPRLRDLAARRAPWR